MGSNREELAAQISYQIVHDVAPDELVLFDDFKEEFLKNPDAHLEKKSEKNNEKMLGFGGIGIEQFLTPAILEIVWSVLLFVGQQGVTSLEDAIIGKYVDGKGKEKEPIKESLSTEKIREIHDYAKAGAISQGMDEKKATIFADSLIGKLMQM